ncbi:MAG TPA: PD-(D/E)XK nuclease family protein [Candidatus Binataceae bacterium]|nr:PD-(D/E)XK nuclease family protein [Candidatus Binataceae bacterium]
MDTLLAIYPTARKVEEVLKQQSRDDCRLGHKVLTFPQLIERLYRECSDRRPTLSPLAERLALEEALQDIAGDARSLLPLSSGVIDHLLGLIREFKGAAINADDLRQAGRAIDRTAATRVSALAEVFLIYQALLAHRGLHDRHDRERQVLSMLQQAEAGGPRPRMLDGVSQLLVAEIYDFTLLQYLIVSSLIRLIGNATVTIQAEPHRVDSWRFPELTWNRFVEDESIADQTLPLFIRRGGRPGRLGFVLRHLFEQEDGELPPPDDTVEIIEAPDRYHEVEETARTIRRALECTEPRRIAVVARDLTLYADYLESIFSRHRIPLSLHHGRPAMASQTSTLVLDTIRLPLTGYRRQALDRLLASDQISTRASDFRWLLRDCGYIDRPTRALMDCLEDYRLRLSARIESAADDAGRRRFAQEMSRATRGADRLGALLDALAELERPSTIVEHIGRLGKVLTWLKFEPIASPDARGREHRSTTHQVVDVIGELADAARLIGSERALSLEEFASLAEVVLSEPRRDPSPPQSDQAVQAFSILDARGLDFDLVFLLGLEDGGLPHYRSEDPILPDQVRIALNRPLANRLQARFGERAPVRKILRITNERNSEDRFLFFLALSMPERRIVLSYPRFDEQGNPYAPSPFVEEVSRLLGHPPHRLVQQGQIAALKDCFEHRSFLNWSAEHAMLARPEVAAMMGEERLRSLRRRIEVERRRERYLALPTREQQASAESSPERVSLVDDYSGRVQASPGLRELLLGTSETPRAWSASMLDEVGACGFKFFASRVLKLGEEEEIDYELSALEVGDLVHRVLYAFFDRPLDFRDRERALAAADDFLDKYQPVARERAIVGENALFDLKWKDIRRILHELVELACEEFRDHVFSESPLLEEPFAFTLRDWHEGKIGESSGRLLRGRIDRLDLNRNQHGLIDRIRVRDYKTARSPGAYADLLEPEAFGVSAFQLPVYLMAALERFRAELAPRVELEAGYLVLRHRSKRQETSVPLARIETDLEHRAGLDRRGEPSIADTIITLIDSALEGGFEVDPRRCDEYCPYRRLCRYHKTLGLS